MIIKVIGNCCHACHTTYQAVKNAATDIDPNIEVQHVSDIMQILQLGIINTPTVIINDKIVTSGEHLTIEQARQLILQNL